jgi:hypothetical protein
MKYFFLAMKDYKQNIDLVLRLQPAFRDLKDRKVRSHLIIFTRLQKNKAIQDMECRTREDNSSFHLQNRSGCGGIG